MSEDTTHATVQRIVKPIDDMQGLVAIALGGSAGAGLADAQSDLDVYIFWRAPLAPPDERTARLRKVADPDSVRVDIHSWGLEDWLTVGGRKIELVYLSLDELQSQIEQAYGDGLDGDAWTTAFLYSAAQSQVYYDPTGELQSIRDRLLASYPEPTYQAILRRRAPLLAVACKDITRAQGRNDVLQAQQRLVAHQALWFNLLFALNRRYHPGEKRLLTHAERCPIRPADLTVRWTDLARRSPDDTHISALISALNADLVVLIEQHSGIRVEEQPW